MDSTICSKNHRHQYHCCSQKMQRVFFWQYFVTDFSHYFRDNLFMQKFPLLLLISATSFLFTACAHHSQNIKMDVSAKNIAGNFEVKKVQFKNGLKLLILKDSSSPTFAYQTWFNVGSRNEVIGKTGLAHLFEHMMFKGTKNHKEGEFDSILEQVGVEGENAFTSNDH